MPLERFKQSPRQPQDGEVSVERVEGSRVRLSVTTKQHPGSVIQSRTENIVMSEFNASRVLGMLAMLLGVRISKSDAKAIKL